MRRDPAGEPALEQGRRLVLPAGVEISLARAWAVGQRGIVEIGGTAGAAGGRDHCEDRCREDRREAHAVLPCLASIAYSGSGIRSVSPGTVGKRSAFQSALACSIRSFEL